MLGSEWYTLIFAVLMQCMITLRNVGKTLCLQQLSMATRLNTSVEGVNGPLLNSEMAASENVP